MPNLELFKSSPGPLVPATDCRNREGAGAYAYAARHALAQYAATGCLNGTFYASAEEQLADVLGLAARVEPGFIARTAVYCRERGHMKDTPALLCAVLSVREPELCERVFDRVIDTGTMLRGFVRIMRSGVVGRKSLGSLPKRLVRRWLAARDVEDLLRASVGTRPSLADVVKMVHPKPGTPERAAFYGWLLGRPHDAAALPPPVRQLEAYKAGETRELPAVPFRMLTSLDLGTEEWARIARRAGWQETRMNLNTYARHGVFADQRPETRLARELHAGDRPESITEVIAARLRDPEAVRKARGFPYQLLVAHATAVASVPAPVRAALRDAVELALDRVPRFPGKVFVFPDVSGSMTHGAVTGYRKGATSKVRCIDVAALVAAAVLCKNPDAEVVPFDSAVVGVTLDARDGVLASAEKLARVGGGGTNCSAPLALLNRRKARGDLALFVSDNQSWVDAGAGRGTAVMHEWSRFKRRNPEARMVCLDVQPYGSTQAREREDILNIGGFSDQVFEVIDTFARGGLAAGHWVDLIEAVEI